MKIVIIGAGAIGSLFAAFLSKSKEEIWLLDRTPERAKIIDERGIRLQGVSGTWSAKIKASSDIRQVGKADLFIIAVKAYHTKEAVSNIGEFLSDSGVVLTVQNGLGNVEIISEVIGQDKVLAGITNQGATLLEPGSIRHAGEGETIIGRLDGRIPVGLRYLRELFNKAGIKTRISKDIKSLLWSKLIINAGINALTAVCGLPNGKLIEYEGARKILEEAVSEAVKVAKRKRVKILYDDPLSKVEAVCQATAENISSMLQDVLKSKQTEIDFINGSIVRQAQALGISCPANTILTNLVRTIESSYKDRIRKE